MVKAEISYNPYLRETHIKFNGQEPRINSLVEKYQSEFLQTWVKKIPGIFYDEMNGYDFELEFTGTKLDFQDLVDAFREAGVSEEEVRIFHKNELNDRINKDEKLDNLIQWMTEHRNNRLDIDELIAQNADLFELTYPFILMHGDDEEDFDFGRIKVSGEVVNDVSELNKTNLTNTPIVFMLDRDTKNLLQGELQVLRQRTDVTTDQLFFIVNSTLDKPKMERIIRDLGIKKPQIVQSLDDEQILKYLKLFPVSEYLHQALTLLRQKTDQILVQLQEENDIAVETNREIYIQINSYDALLKKLKEASYKFSNQDNQDMPDEWTSYKNEFNNKIASMRTRRTKITGESEGEAAADTFNSEVSNYYIQFMGKLRNSGFNKKDEIINGYREWFSQIGTDEKFDITNIEWDIPEMPPAPSMAWKLCQLRTTEYVNDKPDLVGFLFKGTSKQEPSTHPVTVYYMENWRNYATDRMIPFVEEYMKVFFNSMVAYTSEVSDAFQKRIDELIKSNTEKKEEIASQLSEDEHKLQQDNDWLTVIRDQLYEIERD